MKIRIEKINGTTKNMALCQRSDLIRFTLVDSVLKTHFKELMQLARLYDPATKTGHIVKNDEPRFFALAEKIEKADVEKSRASHAKTAAKAKTRKANNISFEDYCEDFLDQHIALMSSEQLRDAKTAYAGLARSKS